MRVHLLTPPLPHPAGSQPPQRWVTAVEGPDGGLCLIDPAEGTVTTLVANGFDPARARGCIITHLSAGAVAGFLGLVEALTGAPPAAAPAGSATNLWGDPAMAMFEVAGPAEGIGVLNRLLESVYLPPEQLPFFLDFTSLKRSLAPAPAISVGGFSVRACANGFLQPAAAPPAGSEAAGAPPAASAPRHARTRESYSIRLSEPRPGSPAVLWGGGLRQPDELAPLLPPAAPTPALVLLEARYLAPIEPTLAFVAERAPEAEVVLLAPPFPDRASSPPEGPQGLQEERLRRIHLRVQVVAERRTLSVDRS